MVKSSKLRQSHPEIVKRLKRVEGHVRSIAAMIEGHQEAGASGMSALGRKPT